MPVTSAPYQPTLASLQNYSCPDWFRNAKFGIWAHWSPQCVPEAGDWYARNMYIQGRRAYEHHIAHYGHPSTFGYKDICRLWKAERWEPDALIERYRRAGARYFVALANHHCNFDCWDSTFHEWNSVRVGPHKDIVGLWAQAARAQGLRFGVTVHTTPGRTWRQFFPVAYGSDVKGPLKGVPYDGNLTKADGDGQWWQGLDPQLLYCRPHAYGSDPDPEFAETWLRRVDDLMEKYRPDLLYFDDNLQPHYDLETWLSMEEWAPQIIANLYNASLRWHDGKQEAVFNIKQVPDEWKRAVVQDMERRHSEEIQPYPWQTDTCIGHWHYERNIQYRGVAEVIAELVDVVSKNGNLLLNIPMRGDGTIDEDESNFLDGLTQWMAVNGEAIYDTRPWRRYGEGANQVPQGYFAKPVTFTAQDFRFTCKGNSLYAFCLAWPDGEAVIRSLAKGSLITENQIVNVGLLGVEGSLSWNEEEDGLHILTPNEKPCEHVYTFKITLRMGTGS